MKNKTPIKVSQKNKDFLNWVATCYDFQNRNKGRRSTPSKVLDLLEQYFKINNDSYLELMELKE